MDTKRLGILSIITLLLTAIWLVMFISDTAALDPNETFEQMALRLSRLDARFYLTYLPVSLLTLVVPLLMAGLYIFCRPHLPQWLALSGLIFTPVYCVMNLFAYLSQISAVPILLQMYQREESRQIADVLLKILLQGYSGSMVAFFNNLAYAILGIPSIIFGLALIKYSKTLSVGGILLAANGAACILGIIGVAANHSLLAWGTVLGGALFFLALFPLSWGFLKG